MNISAHFRRGASPTIIIVLIVLVLALGGGAWWWMGRGESKQPSSTTKEGMMEKNEEEKVAIQFKTPREFFPTFLNSQPMLPLADFQDYFVTYIKNPEYTDGNKSIPVLAAFNGVYGTEENPAHRIIVGFFQFKNQPGVAETFRTFNDETFEDAALGFEQTEISLPENVESWVFIQKDKIPANKTAELFSGDIRLFFPKALVNVQIKTMGGYSEEEIINIVKEYVEKIFDPATEYIMEDDIFTAARYQELQ